MILVEIKFIKRGILPTQIPKKQFERVQAILSTLPDDLRRRFEFNFAIAAHGPAAERTDRLESAIERLATEVSIQDFQSFTIPRNSKKSPNR